MLINGTSGGPEPSLMLEAGLSPVLGQADRDLSVSVLKNPEDGDPTGFLLT